MQNTGISVVIPAYNEARSLPDLIKEITTALRESSIDTAESEIIIVDDGSTDTTYDAITHLSELFDQVKGVRLYRNYGQTAAIAAGIEHATNPVIVTLDADGQNDPHDIPRLVLKLQEGYQCVNGWRVERADSLVKRIPSFIQTHLTGLTGPDIKDYGCTLAAYDATALRDIDLIGDGHRYIPAMLHDRGYRITELPVNHRERTHGTTKYGPGRLIRGFVDLLFHTYWNRYSSRPLHFLGTIGLLTIFLAGLIGGHALLIKYVFGVPLSPHLPRLILTVGLVMFGVLILGFGLIAEMLTRIYYQGEREYRVQTRIGFGSLSTEPRRQEAPAVESTVE